jgi:hypothetical protein
MFGVHHPNQESNCNTLQVVFLYKLNKHEKMVRVPILHSSQKF